MDFKGLYLLEKQRAGLFLTSPSSSLVHRAKAQRKKSLLIACHFNARFRQLYSLILAKHIEYTLTFADNQVAFSITTREKMCPLCLDFVSSFTCV